jgi:hypothetical protein
MRFVNDILNFGSSTLARVRAPYGGESGGRLLSFIRETFWGTDRRRNLLFIIIVITYALLLFFKLGMGPTGILYVSVTIVSFALIVMYPFIGITVLFLCDVILPYREIGLRLMGINITLTKSLGLLIILAFFIKYTVANKKIHFGNKYQVVLLYIFTIIGILSSYNAFHLKQAKLEVSRLLLNAVLYIVVVNLMVDERKVLFFYNIVTLAIFYTCFHAVYEAFVLHVPRPMGGFGLPNDLGLYACLGFAFLLVLFLESDKIYIKIYSLSGLLITSVGLLLSNTRSGFVAYIITLAIQFVRKRFKYIYSIPLIMILVVLLNIIPETYTNRPIEFISKVYVSGMGAVEHETRYALYRTGIDLFLKNPFLGVGPWNFRFIYKEEYAEKYHGRNLKLVPHSGVTGLLAEFGMFAFTAFFAYLALSGYIFRKTATIAQLLSKRRERIAILATEAMFWAFFTWGVFQDIAGMRLAYLYPAVGAALYYKLSNLSEQDSIDTDK